MKKLELKHLAPYLPYDLQGVDEFNNFYYLYSLDIRMSSFDLWMNGHFHKFNGLDGIKPILRPLSDLKKEIEHNVGRFVPLYKMIKEDKAFTNDFTDAFGYEELKVSVYELLLEYHFDIFGLIDKGLAIDINTLK